MRMFPIILATLGVGAVILTACDKPASDKPSSNAPVQPAAAIPASLFIAEAPADPKNVGEVKKNATAGQEVVITGRIGGSEAPFVDGRAMFMLADVTTMKACDEMGSDDHCTKPWDYCCEPRELLVANTCTVQVVGDDGRPLKATLKGAGALADGSRVIVRGKVAQKADQTLVINAEAIFVKS